MSHRFTTWWRALSVVLLSLATVTWPTAARADTTPTVTLVHQQAIVTLPADGLASFTTTLALAPASADTRADLTLYPVLITRGALEGVIAGHGAGTRPMSSTGEVGLRCVRDGRVTFSVELASGRRHGRASTCDGVRPRLRLACAGAACDGVYPLRIAVDVDGARSVTWSLLAVRTRGTVRPLQVALIDTLPPGALAHPTRSLAALRALAQLSHTPLTISANYETLGSIDLDATTGAKWATALNAALASPLHRAVDAPPGTADFAGLVDNGLTTQVAQQLDLSQNLLQSLTGRYVDAPVLLSGRQSPASLLALAGDGATDVVLPEKDLTEAPSNTLTWGAPFHVAGSLSTSALAADGPLSRLVSDTSVAPGRRAVLTVATLAFLHYEAPNAPASRSVVIEASLADTSRTLLDDLVEGLRDDPFSVLTSLTPLFESSLVGTNGAPAARSLTAMRAPVWSSHNVSSLLTLIGAVNSYTQGVKSGDEAVALRVAVARAETVGSPAGRQSAIDAATSRLDVQLAQFSIDSSAITLAGQGNALPITIISRAGYKVDAVVHLVTDGLSFPKGAAVPVTLASPTESVTVPTANPRGSSLTLQVVLTTPNDQVILARTAIQVRIAGASVVGYLLTGASLFVLGWWWWRTNRRRPKGRHAR
jgi:hypothetical protein